MKRGTLVAVAVLLTLMLVYPAVTVSAGTPRPRDIPTIMIITPQSGDTPAFSGDDGSGDADDLAGIKNTKKMPDGSPGISGYVIRLALSAQMWRQYFFGLGLYR